MNVDQLWSDNDPPDVRGLQRGNINWPSFECFRLYKFRRGLPPTFCPAWCCITC